MPIAIDARRKARSLYWRYWTVTQIADELALSRSTVEAWRVRDKWDDAPSLTKIEDAIEARLCGLIEKDQKSGGDYKEIDLLMRAVVSAAKVRRYEQPGGHEGDLNDKVANRNAGERKAKAPPNHFTADQIEQLKRIFHDGNFEYQELWWSNRDQRTRMLLKSRQIGASYYFAREALIDALETGHNKIFLSASRSQALVFRKYIVSFAARVGVKLKGDPIVLSSELLPDRDEPLELVFLGTNARTAQGYHGDFYFDEFFWTFGFDELNKVAKAMASHKFYRKTYLSTPSSVAHQAYAMWTGAAYNRNRKKADRVEIDVSYEALKGGHVGADRIWRHMLTLEDAEAQGCDLFDIEEIKAENAPSEYANLYNCQFVDDSLSAFKFNELQRATVDTLVAWTDVNLLGARPVGMREVWAGYDPQESEDGDNASLVIALPPTGPDGKFRLIERHQLRGVDFEGQADFIIGVLARYNCTYLGIDANGVGAAVYQVLERKGVRGLKKIEYSLEAKAMMVMKAQHSFARQRIEFDAGWIDLQSSFLSIKKTLTRTGRSITFKASRTDDVGHADVAWATMHILINEPLDGKAAPKTRMEIFDGQEDAPDVGYGEPDGNVWVGRAGRRDQCDGRRDRRLRVRRPGSRARPTPSVRPVRMLAQRQVVRAAGQPRRAGTGVQRRAAS